MKKASLFVSFALMTVFSPFAAAEHLYLGSNLGALFLDDDRLTAQQDDSNLFGGFNLGVDADSYAAELSISTDISGADVDLYSISLYKFLDTREDGNWAPYLLGGYTYSDMTRTTYPVDDVDSLHLGIGMAKFLTEKWEFRGDLRAYGSISEEINFAGDPGTLVDFGTMLSLNYHFGRVAESRAATPQRVEPTPAAEPAPAPAPVAVPVAEPVYLTRTIELNVLFATNADTALSYGDEVDEIGQAMAENANLQLSLEGHTDSMGAAEYNKDLSQRRAETVRAKIIADYGISGSRISAMGYGEERPVASNETSQGRAQNRRVVGVLSWEELAE